MEDHVFVKRAIPKRARLPGQPQCNPLSGAPFEGRVALGLAGEPAFGSPRRPTAGFRRLSGRAQVRQKRRNDAVDPDRRQAAGGVAALPGQPTICDARPRQPKLDDSL